MSRADDTRDERPKPKAARIVVSPAARVVLDDDPNAFYLARIAELEAEIRTLKAALAKLDAPGGPIVQDVVDIQPTHVIADGTQGVRRGVSGR